LTNRREVFLSYSINLT